jgi:hypothetical protein
MRRPPMRRVADCSKQCRIDSNNQHPCFLKGEDMKRIKILFALAFLFSSVQVCLSDDHQADARNMGTWKLNEANSKLATGTTKNHTVIYEAAGDNTKVIVEGIDSAGKTVRSEWIGKFDGKYYPVTGDPTSDMRSYKHAKGRAMTFTAKQGNNVTLSGRIELSTDGKTRTVTTTATDSAGKKVTSMAFYNKQ